MLICPRASFYSLVLPLPFPAAAYLLPFTNPQHQPPASKPPFTMLLHTHHQSVLQGHNTAAPLPNHRTFGWTATLKTPTQGCWRALGSPSFASFLLLHSPPSSLLGFQWVHCYHLKTPLPSGALRRLLAAWAPCRKPSADCVDSQVQEAV